MDLKFTAASLGGVCPGVSVVFRLSLGGVLATSWCLENVESLGGVSVMPRWCLKMIMTKYAGNNLLDLVGKKPFAGPFGNCWCVSCWCLGRLSIVFRWSLVSWWHFGGVSVVS